MTKQMNWNLKCHDCGFDLVCPKCGKVQKLGTPFSLWIRDQEELDSRKCGIDAQNLDFIWCKYKEGWFILLEEKQHGSEQKGNQRDTHMIVHQLLEKANGLDIEINTARGRRKVTYKGYFLIQFEKTNPDDSKWIKINGVEYNGVKNENVWEHEVLMGLLITGRLPDF